MEIDNKVKKATIENQTKHYAYEPFTMCFIAISIFCFVILALYLISLPIFINSFEFLKINANILTSTRTNVTVLLSILGILAAVIAILLHFRYRKMPSKLKLKSDFIEGMLHSGLVDGGRTPDTFRYSVKVDRHYLRASIYFRIIQPGRQFKNIPIRKFDGLAACFQPIPHLEALSVPSQDPMSRYYDSVIVLTWGGNK